MLSGETANGAFPALAASTMADIVTNAEVANSYYSSCSFMVVRCARVCGVWVGGGGGQGRVRVRRDACGGVRMLAIGGVPCCWTASREHTPCTHARHHAPRCRTTPPSPSAGWRPWQQRCAAPSQVRCRGRATPAADTAAGMV
jgi:hypothetical protein